MDESIVIRAAAFHRLVANIAGFTLQDVSNIFGDDYILHYLANSSPESCFPTSDLKSVADIIYKVLQCYFKHGDKIHEKFSMLYPMQQIFNELSQNEKKYDLNKRGKEVADMSKSFYELSKQIQGKTVEYSCEKVNIEFHGFHPESEFVAFSVKL